MQNVPRQQQPARSRNQNRVMIQVLAKIYLVHKNLQGNAQNHSQ